MQLGRADLHCKQFAMQLSGKSSKVRYLTFDQIPKERERGGCWKWGEPCVGRHRPGLIQEPVLRIDNWADTSVITCNLHTLPFCFYTPSFLLWMIYIFIDIFYSIMCLEPTAIRLSCCSRMEEKRELRRYLPNTTKTKRWVQCFWYLKFNINLGGFTRVWQEWWGKMFLVKILVYWL